MFTAELAKWQGLEILDAFDPIDHILLLNNLSFAFATLSSPSSPLAYLIVPAMSVSMGPSPSPLSLSGSGEGA